MNLVYNSEHYSVLAYPAQHGFELVDKDCGRSMFVQGLMADSFHQNIQDVADATDGDAEEIDSFLDQYCAGSVRPIAIH